MVTVVAHEAVPLALPGISSTLGVSDAQVGLVMTAFFLPATIMMLLVGMLADVYGRRRVVIPSLAIFGAAGVGIFFVNSFELLLGLRVLQGAAFPALTPLSTALIGDLYEGEAGAAAQGLRASGNGLASLLGPAIAGVLAGIAWQYPFLLSGLAFPAMAIVYLYLPKIETDQTGVVTVDDIGTRLRALGRQFLTPNLQLLAVGAATIYFVLFAIITFLPIFAVRSLGVSVAATGLLLSIRGGVRIFVSPLSGTVVAWFSRRTVLIATMLLIGASTLLIPFLPGILSDIQPVVPLALLMGGYSIGEAIFNPVLNDSVINIAVEEHRGAIVNGISVFKDGASALSPAFFGLVLTATNFELLFLVAGIIPILYVPLLIVIFKPDSASPSAVSD